MLTTKNESNGIDGVAIADELAAAEIAAAWKEIAEILREIDDDGPRDLIDCPANENDDDPATPAYWGWEWDDGWRPDDDRVFDLWTDPRN